MLGLALPAGASADGGCSLCLNTAAVSKHDGFKLALFANQGAALVANKGASGNPNSVSASLVKQSGTGIGGVSQINSYSFFKGITFTGKADLSSAHLEGTFAKSRGSIKMTFHATHPASKVPVPSGCTGTPGESRRGTLSGSFDLHADKLGAINVSSIGATLLRSAKITGCKGGGGGHATTVAGYSTTSAGFGVNAAKPQGTSFVSEDISVSRNGDGFNFFHDLSVLAPRSSYTFSANLSRATLKGYGPIHGSASYKGSPASQGGSHGTLSGDLSVAMATLGTVKPFASGPLGGFQVRY